MSKVKVGPRPARHTHHRHSTGDSGQVMGPSWGPSIRKQPPTPIADLINQSVGASTTPAKHTRKNMQAKPRKDPPKDTWKRRTRHMIKYSKASTCGRIYLYSMLTAIVLDFIHMVLETLDGPANGGSDPTYPYLPTEQTYFACEVAFTVLFSADFLVKCLVARIQRKFWTQFVTWMDLLAVLPLFGSLFMQYVLGWSAETRLPINQYLELLQLFRVVRVAYMLRNVDGMRVLRITFTECLAPLQITLFFLVMIVMIFATMLYYAEPCYDDRTCPFKDIFNAGFFVMATVSTTGYGDQVPSTDNVVAVLITCAVMIFGSLYLAMPLAIIGIKYERNWRRFINYSRTTRSIVELKDDLRSTTIESVNGDANRVNLQYFQLTTEVAHLVGLVQDYLSVPPDEIFSGQSSQALNDLLARLHRTSRHVITRYRIIVAEMKVFRPHTKKLPTRPTKIKRMFSLRSLVLKLLLWAKDVVQGDHAGIASESHLPHQFDRPLRKHLRHVLHITDAHHSYGLNRFFLVNVILSLLVFYAETTPELQTYGPQSYLCHGAMQTYCASATMESDPGCFIWASANTTSSPPARLQFDCFISSASPAATTASSSIVNATSSPCFAAGWNFGSASSQLDCTSSFASPDKICNLRQCQRGHTPLVDMTTHWLYFEAYFGVIFTIEFALRLYAAKHRRRFLRSPSTWVDMAAILPFYAEGIVAATVTTSSSVYAIVSTFPTFFSILPMMKSLRLFKLGRHFKSTSVLTRTARLTYRRLAIHLFFLFMASVLTATLFYEIERGIECHAHVPCFWHQRWDVMTKDIAAPFPPGKRIQVQQDRLTLLTDMWRTMWLSASTLTTVGYGDLKPRAPLGRLFDIVVIVFGCCYIAMPLSVVGSQFHACYEEFLRKSAKVDVENDDEDDSNAKSSGATAASSTDNPSQQVLLSVEDNEMLKKCSMLLLLVDEMMQHMYKINLLSPTAASLNVMPHHVGIHKAEVRAKVTPLERFSADSIMIKRRQSITGPTNNVVPVATMAGPRQNQRKGSLVATTEARMKRFKELQHLVQVGSTHLTVHHASARGVSYEAGVQMVMLQLTRVLEKVVVPVEGAFQDDERFEF
ncbi:Aste57867_14049 [Aphanomyces stellatus]|uniref:Aste57867_14049 protein n=1 Tax=Aphanomyces stellatus TaxID=120398 RepID=A0A485KZN6_9STRA|nr:hypothetical protein As57867_013998 [Aphanomyces stellatus]VFT90878.1 Aste57867_14049 [Aphanomyces stellatus]